MTARDDAARWFAARRRGVMTLEECAAHQQWLARDANRAAMTEMESLWAALEGAGGQSLNNARDAGPSSGRKIMVAVMCVISLGIGALSYTGNPSFWTSLDWTNR